MAKKVKPKKVPLANTSRTTRCLAKAQVIARHYGQNYVGTHHVMLALLEDPSPFVEQAFEKAGLTLTIFELRKLLDNG